MLRTLSIRDFILIDALDLDLEAGFSALTGETGAGKSILIDALTLALGARADGNVVRAGAQRAEIGLEWDLRGAPGARAWLAENDLADEDANVCLFRRVLETGGRSKSFINGTAVTLSQMRDLAERLIDIHGQHAHQTLLKREAQLALLDDFAGHEDLLAATARAHRDWAELARMRSAREVNEAAIAREFEDLSWQINELAKLYFSPERFAETEAEQRRLANAASLIASAEGAIEALSEGERPALDSIESIARDLGNSAETDPELKDAAALVQSAAVELTEAVSSLRHYLRRLDADPARLAELDRRIADVHEAARKFRIEPARIPEVLQQKRDRLASLGGGRSLEALIEQERAAFAAYGVAAAALGKSRHAAAKRFAAEVTRSLHELAMGGGRLSVEFAPREASAVGLESCEFMVCAHEGQPVGPLAKIASGGELSRISLAIQMMASTRGGVPVMVFDEVDAGIGGRVAEIVGRLLRRLGQKHQVLAVTHLAQVAACAHAQFEVSKSETAGRVQTAVTPLNGKARIEEIARMLGGLSITAATRKAAAEMIERAEG
ncbi:MAG: DNA repair protein RecN [Betaproteobacteria bacterium]|nr:DNA repair protein RecN [Betaproteobacteria bacterium]